jgi:hypothetical protein
MAEPAEVHRYQCLERGEQHPSFTWSKVIDYGREVQINNENAAAGGFVSQFVKELPLNRARADLDRTLAYNLSFLYELPWGQGKRWMSSGPASWILGGWQIGGILSLLNGPPLTQYSFPDVLNCLCGVRGNLVGDQRRGIRSQSAGCVRHGRPGPDRRPGLEELRPARFEELRHALGGA